MRSLARTHVYCYKKNGQMIVDRKELSKKRKMVAEKKGNLTLSPQAETANMRLHISAFLQNTHCYKKKITIKSGQMIKDRKDALKK